MQIFDIIEKKNQKEGFLIHLYLTLLLLDCFVTSIEFMAQLLYDIFCDCLWILCIIFGTPRQYFCTSRNILNIYLKNARVHRHWNLNDIFIFKYQMNFPESSMKYLYKVLNVAFSKLMYMGNGIWRSQISKCNRNFFTSIKIFFKLLTIWDFL